MGSATKKVTKGLASISLANQLFTGLEKQKAKVGNRVFGESNTISKQQQLHANYLDRQTYGSHGAAQEDILGKGDQGPPPPPPPTPLPDESFLRVAKRKAAAKLLSRGGRQSTILGGDSGDILGG